MGIPKKIKIYKIFYRGTISINKPTEEWINVKESDLLQQMDILMKNGYVITKVILWNKEELPSE